MQMLDSAYQRLCLARARPCQSSRKSVSWSCVSFKEKLNFENFYPPESSTVPAPDDELPCPAPDSDPFCPPLHRRAQIFHHHLVLFVCTFVHVPVWVQARVRVLGMQVVLMLQERLLLQRQLQ